MHTKYNIQLFKSLITNEHITRNTLIKLKLDMLMFAVVGNNMGVQQLK